MRSTKSGFARLIDATAITSAVPLSTSSILVGRSAPPRFKTSTAGPDATNFPEQDFIARMREVQVREPEATQLANQSAVNGANIAPCGQKERDRSLSLTQRIVRFGFIPPSTI